MSEWRAIAFGTIVALAAGCGGVVARGDRALDRGELAEARQLSMDAIERRDTDVEAWLLRARVERADGNLTAAAHTLLEAAERFPDDARVHRAALDLARDRGDEETWGASWLALHRLGTPPVLPDLDLAIEGFGAIARLDPQRARPLLAAIVDSAGGDAPDALESEVDLRLYQLAYVRDAEASAALIGVVRDELGDLFLLRKHEIIIALETRGSRALSELEALVGGDVDRMSAIAYECARRGTWTAAQRIYGAVAARTEGDARADALIDAADAAWGSARRTEAVTLIEEAVEVAEHPVAAALRAYTVARGRGAREEGDRVLAQAAVEARCDTDELEELERAELTLARDRLSHAVPHAMGTSYARLYARAATCDVRFARSGGALMFEFDAWPEAAGLLSVAADAEPGDPTVLVPLIASLEAVGDAEQAADRARAFVGALSAGRSSLTDDEAQAMVDVLSVGRSAELAQVRIELLADAFERAPEQASLAFALAQEQENAGDLDARRTTLARHIEARGGEIEARYRVARWLSENSVVRDEAWNALVEVAQDPAAAGVPAAMPVSIGRTIEESAWLAALAVAQGTGDETRVVQAIDAFADARGPDDPQTWEDIWSMRQEMRWLSPARREHVIERALAAGHETAELLSELGSARLARGATDEAVEAWLRAIELDTRVAPALVERLASSDQGELAIRLVRRYAELRGESAFTLRTLAALWADLSARTRGRDALRYAGQARAAWRAYLDGGYPVAELDLSAMRLPGFYDLAAEAQMRLVDSDATRDESTSRRIALDLLRAGRPWAEASPWLEPWLADDGSDEQRRLWMTLYELGYRREAVPIALASIAADRTVMAERVERIVDVAELLATSADRDVFAAFVHEYLVEAARRIADPVEAPPRAFLLVRERDRWATDLYSVAAGLLEQRGLWAEAADVAERALVTASSDDRLELERAIRVAHAAAGGRMSRETLDRLVGACDENAVRAWGAAGEVLTARGDHALAAQAWERALALSGEPRWHAEVIGALARAGDAAAMGIAVDRALALFDDRRPDVEMTMMLDAIIRHLDDLGYDELADRVITGALQRGVATDAHERALAIIDARFGRVEAAQRRLEGTDDAPLASRDIIRAWYLAGFTEIASRRWLASTDRLSDADNVELAMQHSVNLARLLGFDALRDVITRNGDARGEMLADTWLAIETTSAGRPGEAASMLASRHEERSRAEWLHIAALFGAAGDSTRATDALRRAAGTSFDASSWDAELVLAPTIEVLNQLGEPVRPFLEDIAAAPDDGARLGALVGLMQLALAEGRIDDAIVLARRAWSERSPNPSYAEFTAGRAAMRQAALERLAGHGFAREAIDIALSETTEVVSREQLLALTLAERGGLTQRAGELADAWARASGEHPGLALELARAQLLGGNADACRAVVEASLPLTSADGAADALSLGLACAVASSDVGAVDAIVDAWNARSTAGWWSAGLLAADLSGIGAWGPAADAWAEVVENSPGQHDTREQLVRALYRAERFDEALAQLDELIAVGDAPASRVAAVLEAVDPRLDSAFAAAVAERLLNVAENLDGIELAARALALAGDDERAVAVLVDAASARGASPYRLAGAMTDMLDDGSWRAVDQLTRALYDERPPTASIALAALEASIRGGDLERAQRLSDAGEALAPDLWSWWFDVAVVAVEHDAFALAEHAATRALVVEPRATSAAALRAIARIGLGDLDGARADLDVSVTSTTDRAWTLRTAVAALAEAGEHGLAARYADVLARETVWDLPPTEPNHSTWTGLAMAVLAWTEGDADAGLAWVERSYPAALAWPELSGASNALASLYDEAGDVPASVNAWERALVFEPDDPILYNNLAWTLAVADVELERAEALARLSIALDGRYNANTVDTLAWALYRQGRYAEALDYSRDCLRMVAVDYGWREAAGDPLYQHLREIEAALRAAPPDESPRRRHRREQ